MAGQTFVLRYRGEGSPPEDDLARIRALPEATIVDESPPRMLLVEAPEGPLRAVVESLSGWIMAREQMLPLPDTRKKVERPPPDG